MPTSPTEDRAADDPQILGANAFVGMNRRQVIGALAGLSRQVTVEPRTAAVAALRTAAQLVEVACGRSEITPPPGDRRFTHRAWSRNPLYRRLMQTYLVERQGLAQLVEDVTLDQQSREQARVAVKLLTEAAAPTNTLLGNPGALAKAVETRGASFVTGLRHFAHDLRHNQGMPSTVDSRPFRVGGNLAVTPGQVVYRSEVFELIQYEPSTPRTHRRPLVIIPPQINKYYVTDLAPGRSLVDYTVAGGISCFALSWRNPTSAQRDWNLDTYVAAGREAIGVACEVSGSLDCNLVGVGVGGITVACLLGHLAATGEGLVNSATLLAAGIDPGAPSSLKLLASSTAIEAARSRSQRTGVLDGRQLGHGFAWLRPNELVWKYWVNNYLLGQNPPALDILYWNADTTRLSAGLYSQLLDLIDSNALVHPGALVVLDTPLDLGSVTCDAYVVAGSTDHIVPWTVAYQTTQMFGGPCEFVLSIGGHIQAIVNPPDHQSSSYLSGPAGSYLTGPDGPPRADPEEWRAGASSHKGSWWDHWLRWLTGRSGPQQPATDALGSVRHRPIEAAPGRYVHLR